MSVAAAERKIARAIHSLVRCSGPIVYPLLSWITAATSSGTKKIRRIVSEFGTFIGLNPTIMRVACRQQPWATILVFHYARFSPPFFFRQPGAAPPGIQEAGAATA